MLKKGCYIKLNLFASGRMLFCVLFLRANDLGEIDIFKGKIN